LKKFRNARGWSQDRMAQELKTKQSYIERWEKGGKIPHAALIEFVLRFKKNDFYWLLFGDTFPKELLEKDTDCPECQKYRDELLKCQGKIDLLKDRLLEDLKKIHAVPIVQKKPIPAEADPGEGSKGDVLPGP
jgi:transcriptional regulator with XRE-family HTH domain